MALVLPVTPARCSSHARKSPSTQSHTPPAAMWQQQPFRQVSLHGGRVLVQPMNWSNDFHQHQHQQSVAGSYAADVVLLLIGIGKSWQLLTARVADPAYCDIMVL